MFDETWADPWADEPDDTSANPRPPPPGPAPIDPREYVPPEIIISTNQAKTVNEAEAALSNLGIVYVKARDLVQVVRDVSESHGLVYQAGAPVIVRVQRERLRELCGVAATWISLRKSKKTGEVTAAEVQCPPWVAATLEQRGGWILPWLDRVSDVPVLRADGSIHDTPGYDAATRTIYDPSTTFPAIPRKPSQKDAAAAYAELVEPMCDVPFVAACDRAAWASLVLTVVARSAIDGCTPMYLVRSPIRGAGKGLSTDVPAVIATGRTAPKRPPATTEDELRKALFAYAIEAPPLVVLDNIEGSLGSPTLAYVVTAGMANDRILGASETRTAAVRYVLVATGNNITTRGDMGRRVAPIDLDPRCENPEDRTGFRYPDLIGHVRRERPRLVVAALTILRAHYVAGLPSHGKPRLGSFEQWDRIVRGAIVHASGVDPLAGIERIREEGDEDTERLHALLTSWRQQLGAAEYTAAEVIKKAGESGNLHDALAAYCRDGKIETRAVGNVLKKLRGRICDGLRLERKPGRANVVRWLVTGESGESGESPSAQSRENFHSDPHSAAPGTDSPRSPHSPPEVYDGDVPDDG